jgi:hypothetical protein
MCQLRLAEKIAVFASARKIDPHLHTRQGYVFLVKTTVLNTTKVEG